MLVAVEGPGLLSERIYQSLRRAILAGEFSAGARLPATRALSGELGVARNTVLLAYEHLLAEGYAVGRVGSGTYVAPTLPEAVLGVPGGAPRSAVPRKVAAPTLSAYGRRLGREASAGTVAPPAAATPRYDFRYGLPAVDAFPHALWRRLVARRMRSASAASLGYGPPEGYLPLRQALADYLRRSRGVACAAEQIVVVNGSQQALDLATRVLLDPGDRVLIEEPHYLGARRAFLAAGARLVPVAVDGDGLDLSTAPRGASAARLAYVTPSHQFPTGAVMSLPRRLALLAWARAAGAHVLEDDYEHEYRYEGRPIEALQGLDRAGRVLYAGTLSKVAFPALRLGYLVLPERLLAPFAAAKWLTDRHTPTLQQEALADFIREGHFERHLRRARLGASVRRAALLEALSGCLQDRVEVAGANAGMHLLVWLRDVAPAELPGIVQRAAGAGVGVYPVDPYYLTACRRAGLLLGYVSMTERDIRDGIRELARVLAPGRGGATTTSPTNRAVIQPTERGGMRL